MADSDARPSSPALDHGPATRWLRPLGAVTTAVVVALSVRTHPLPALHGDGLGVTLALIVLLASAVVMLRRAEPGWSVTLASAAIVCASAALVWLQRGGPGIAALFMAASYSALRLPLSRSLAVAGLAIAALAAAMAHAKHSAGAVVSIELGVAAFYVLSIFARRVQEAHEETARLLVELRESRRAQEDAAALRERSRIAREIHDVLAHSLSGLMLQLEGARMLAGTANANGQLPAALDRAHHLARAGLAEARRAVGALRDDDLPGPHRLERLTADFSRDSGVEARLEVSGEPRPLGAQSSLTLFRVAQEALTNARRHSGAERVDVQLVYESEGVRLLVEDHIARPNVGFAAIAALAPDAPAGYGLTGMRERAALLGGTLDAAPTEQGFRVELWIPT